MFYRACSLRPSGWCAGADAHVARERRDGAAVEREAESVHAHDARGAGTVLRRRAAEERTGGQVLPLRTAARAPRLGGEGAVRGDGGEARRRGTLVPRGGSVQPRGRVESRSRASLRVGRARRRRVCQGKFRDGGCGTAPHPRAGCAEHARHGRARGGWSPCAAGACVPFLRTQQQRQGHLLHVRRDQAT